MRRTTTLRNCLAICSRDSHSNAWRILISARKNRDPSREYKPRVHTQRDHWADASAKFVRKGNEELLSLSLSLSLSATQDMRRTFFSITHTPTTTLGNSIPFCPCPRSPPRSASISAMPPGCKLSLPACNSSSKDRCCRSSSSSVHRRRRRRRTWRVWSHGREKKKHTHRDYDGSGLRNEKTPANQPSTLSQMREERERYNAPHCRRDSGSRSFFVFPFFFNSAARTATSSSSASQQHRTSGPLLCDPLPDGRACTDLRLIYHKLSFLFFFSHLPPRPPGNLAIMMHARKCCCCSWILISHRRERERERERKRVWVCGEDWEWAWSVSIQASSVSGHVWRRRRRRRRRRFDPLSETTSQGWGAANSTDVNGNVKILLYKF